MRNIPFSVLVMLFFIVCPMSAFERSMLAPLASVSHADLRRAIQSAVLANNLPNLKDYIIKNPSQFRALDVPSVYLDVATNYYRQRNFFLALMVATEGYFMAGSSNARALCAYFAARVLYRQENRESALFYVNRSLELISPEHRHRPRMQRMKRRIRWEYISRSEGMPDESISDIYFDGDDVWFGMWIGGLARFTRSSLQLRVFSRANSGLRSDHVRTMKLEGNILWVGTFNGLCWYDKRTGRWTTVRGELGSAPVKRLELHENRLYAATLGRGLFVREGDNFRRIFHASVHVSDVLHVGRWRIIATMDRGVYVFEGDRQVAHILPRHTVKALALYRGMIYGGTHGNGMFAIKPGDWTNISWVEGLSSAYVETLYVYRNVLVAGTLGGGVNFLFPDNHIRVLTILDGLSSNDVMRIRSERNRLWFGTLAGGISILLVENMEDI